MLQNPGAQSFAVMFREQVEFAEPDVIIVPRD